MEMSLAIVERQAQSQGQRPVAGCVGVLFLHLLDWNRRLAKKKKRFAKRSLLPPLLKRCHRPTSPCASLSPLPQLTSSEQPQVGSTTPMRAPGLVARLMGLESMPVSEPSEPQKDPYTQFQPSKGTQPSKDLCLEARPLKIQKTSNGSDDFIINSDLSHLKKYHHNSTHSSARSPRARLIQAAAKILEPGLRPKLALSPLNSSVRNVEENIMAGSLLETEINIGAFSENEMEMMVVSGKLPQVDFTVETNTLEETRGTREDALKYIDQDRKCMHVEQRTKNLVISGCKMEINHNLKRNTGEQRQASNNKAFMPVTTSKVVQKTKTSGPNLNKRLSDKPTGSGNPGPKKNVDHTHLPVTTGKVVPRTKVSGANLNKRVTDKPIGPGYFGPKKNVSHTIKSGNSINAENRKRRTAIDLSNKTELLPVCNRSGNRVSPERDMLKKRENTRASFVFSSRVKPVSKRSTVNRVEKQTIPFEKERLKLKEHASNLVGSILEDLVQEISEDTGLCLRGGNTPHIGVRQGEKITGLSSFLATLDSDQPSPISILEASFSNDSCSSGSPIDETDSMMLFSSNDTVPKLLDINSFDTSTETTSSSNFQILGSRVGCKSEVFSSIELLFGNHWVEEDNTVHSFLLDLLKNVMDAFSGSLNGEKEGCQLTNFLFDCVIECLDRKYGYLCKSGYKGWLVICQSLSRDHLFEDSLKELHSWSDMAGKGLHVLADKDLGNTVNRWSKYDFEGFEIGVEIESTIIDTLVDEFIFDLQ